ncbi:MAG TPA: M23 family metallopeptidase [Acidimicrobiales bacterium]|nr:M23 family metallopeptidase [Acidimicrobiales bacterium]
MRHVLAAAIAAAIAASAGPALGAAVAEPVQYRPPVDAPVIDGFRPPATPYGPGNRGVDYATNPGAPVTAAAGGVVTFAGRVGSGLHVVVLHADGIRTSVSFLASVDVRRGQRVAAGERLGTAGRSLHFGARSGDAYLDPLELLGAGPAAVRLVPDAPGRMGTDAGERQGLRRSLAGAAGAREAVAATAVDWARPSPRAAPGRRRLARLDRLVV